MPATGRALPKGSSDRLCVAWSAVRHVDESVLPECCGSRPAGPVTIVDALLGRVRYDWQPGDTDEAGVYDSWVKVTQAGALTSFPSDRSHEVKIDL